MKNIKIPVDLTTIKQIKLQWDNSKKNMVLKYNLEQRRSQYN